MHVSRPLAVGFWASLTSAGIVKISVLAVHSRMRACTDGELIEQIVTASSTLYSVQALDSLHTGHCFG